ncbi:MAG TPA: hypothetical protein VIM64_20450 [Puia sp.]
MQKMWWSGLLLPVLLGVGALSGCKKKSDKATVCHVMGIYEVQDSINESLAYDSQGRLSVAAAGSQLYTYEHSDHQTVITYYSAGLLIGKTTAITNQDGLAVNVRVENTQTGVAWINYANEYEDQRIIRTTITTSDNKPVAVTTYLWTDGNMTASVNGADTTRFTYYTDKPSQTGDYLSLAQLTSGYEQYRVKNLFKGQNDISFEYAWGSDGKISALKEVSGGSDVAGLLLQYQCE